MTDFRSMALAGAVSGLLTLGAGVAAAQDAPDIAIANWSEVVGDTQYELEGPQGQAIKAVMEATGDDVSWQVMANERAYRGFAQKRWPCVTPDARIYYGEDADILESTAINMADWLVVTGPDGPLVTEKDGLKGMSVGLDHEPEYLGGILPDGGFEAQVHADLANNVAKVYRGRVDSTVLWASALREILDNNPEYQELTYDFDQPFLTVPDAVICHDTPRGREVMEKVNAGFDKVGRARIDELLGDTFK
jgi:hypothetical protein